MNKKLFHTNEVYGLLPLDIEGIDSLVELAINLRWSWNHSISSRPATEVDYLMDVQVINFADCVL